MQERHARVRRREPPACAATQEQRWVEQLGQLGVERREDVEERERRLHIPQENGYYFIFLGQVMKARKEKKSRGGERRLPCPER